ncbi:putative mediator complex subunit 21 [Tieghemostelium lacteum]|uniref:Mediator of RNA polymerase II transcription subunit 21 n=1 Tax=Tieghemostelium lacteum TaxID=361077 RepID=A0A151ZD00_TIELA|nr:putative mediator complex subunit 21 [Tieghemostelium lacteum]|eukprot:KYQ91754.1 putative mediator complex subunit 21 [Tieghemostelium lacteum]
MADRLTQLQNQLDQLFLVFGTCIGVLQRDAPQSSFVESSKLPPEWGTQVKDMAKQVIDSSKLIESYIESLPGFDRTETEQYENLKQLDIESKDSTNQLNLTKLEAIDMLNSVKDAIRIIAEESKNQE